MKKNVTVVLPNYNGQHLLKKYLPSVLANLSFGDEVIIVDDTSTDNSIKWLIKSFKLVPSIKHFNMKYVSDKYFPNLMYLDYNLFSNYVEVNNKKINFTLIALKTNMRFAAASNVGFALAETPLVFLLNTDVKLTDGVVNRLRTHFNDESLFAVGCLEYEKNKTGNISGKNKLWFEKGLFMHSRADDMLSGPTAWVSGGSGMFSREKWMKLNGFNQEFYPAYWEDVDISFRAKKQGYQVLFDQEAVVFHIHESTNSDIFGQHKIDNMSWINAQKFTRLNGSKLQKIIYRFFQPYWKRKRKLFEDSKYAM